MLISEDMRFFFALAVLVIGIIAVSLIPGAEKIKKRKAKWYSGSGKYLVFILALVVISAGGVLGYDWYKAEDPDIWFTGNVVVFLCFGLAIIAGNAMTIKNIKKLPKKVAKKPVAEPEPVEVHVVEAEVIELPPRPVKKTKKKTKKKVKKAEKKVKKTKKKVKEPKPSIKESLERICESCGSEIGSDIIECPICGFDIADAAEAYLECPECGHLNEENATKCKGCEVHFDLGED